MGSAGPRLRRSSSSGSESLFRLAGFWLATALVLGGCKFKPERAARNVGAFELHYSRPTSTDMTIEYRANQKHELHRITATLWRDKPCHDDVVLHRGPCSEDVTPEEILFDKP